MAQHHRLTPQPATHGSADRIRVLMELRPCFDGYAGIPQETRLLFGALARAANLHAGGLLNGTGSEGHRPGRRVGDANIELMSQTEKLISLDTGNGPGSLGSRLLRRIVPNQVFRPAELLSHWGQTDELTSTLDPTIFGDWLWMRLFRLALPASERHLLSRATFPVARMSWGDAARLATLNTHGRPVLDMEAGGWDIHIAHTPSPYRLKGGRMIVRYHDAIPILWPHTISHARNHARSHFRMLQANVADNAWFVCTSDPVRDDLIRLFPRAAERSVTIPTMSSGTFRPDPRSAEHIKSIIERGRKAGARRLQDAAGAKRDAANQPSAGNLSDIGDEPFILAVSTLEPRKNYALLLRAAAMAHRGGARFRLVLIANPGWRSDEEVKLLRQLVAENVVYHLSDVPMIDMRALYTAAHAVICPSRAEGFDLATVEAMGCGAPLLASDIPVHRWVCGDAAEYFDPYDEEALSFLLRDVSAAPRRFGRLAELSDKGLRQSALYRPERLEPLWEETIERVARS